MQSSIVNRAILAYQNFLKEEEKAKQEYERKRAEEIESIKSEFREKLIRAGLIESDLEDLQVKLEVVPREKGMTAYGIFPWHQAYIALEEERVDAEDLLVVSATEGPGYYSAGFSRRKIAFYYSENKTLMENLLLVLGKIYQEEWEVAVTELEKAFHSEFSNFLADRDLLD